MKSSSARSCNALYWEVPMRTCHPPGHIGHISQQHNGHLNAAAAMTAENPLGLNDRHRAAGIDGS